MKRRDFIKRVGSLAGAASLSIGGMPLRAFAKPFFNITANLGKILVVVQLKGGNDGHNTVIPIEDSLYYNKRPTLSIPKNDAVKLDNLTGLHPMLQPFKEFYDNGMLSIIQNVGYENPVRSHFRSTDIWLSGSDANEYLSDGWVGRYLANTFPDFPNTSSPQPMAIQIGSVQSLLLESQHGGMGVTIEDPNTFYQLVQGSEADNDPPPATLAGEELRYLKQVAARSLLYADVIKEKADAGKNLIAYPNTGLGNQLSIIAGLINGGLNTPVYLATLKGFDTHANQLSRHETLLSNLATAVAAFQKDLGLAGLEDRVVVLTISEFGRRLRENASDGTDHGTAAPMFLIGKNVAGGIVGDNPDLTKLDRRGDISHTYDFRQIYASILSQHFQTEDAAIQQILPGEFATLPLINNNPNSVGGSEMPKTFALNQNYPNPFNAATLIPYSISRSGNVQLNLYDIKGRMVRRLVDRRHTPGQYTVQLDASELASGIYFYRIVSGEFYEQRRMTLVK